MILALVLTLVLSEEHSTAARDRNKRQNSTKQMQMISTPRTTHLRILHLPGTRVQTSLQLATTAAHQDHLVMSYFKQKQLSVRTKSNSTHSRPETSVLPIIIISSWIFRTWLTRAGLMLVCLPTLLACLIDTFLKLNSIFQVTIWQNGTHSWNISKRYSTHIPYDQRTWQQI